jgi:hypothetical protein
MPKAAGGSMKTIKLAGKAPAPTRKIMHQASPSGPKLRPTSPGVSQWADRLKQSPDGADPRQMVPEMSARNKRY